MPLVFLILRLLVWLFSEQDWYWTGGTRIRRSRPTLALWRGAAEGCGLHVKESANLPVRTLTAELAAIRVRFTELPGEEHGTEITIAVSGASPHAARLRPQSGAPGRRERRGVELEVGDPPFDDAFFIGGPPARLLACLDRSTRAALLTLQGQARVWIANGELRASMEEGGLEAPLRRFLQAAIEVAGRLLGSCDVPAELARNARSDIAGVRLQNLLALIREYPDHAITTETLAVAATDAVPQIRLRAAQALGEQGVEVLQQLAEDLAIEDESAAAAVISLGTRLPAARLLSILAMALRARRLQTAATCIDALGNRRAAEAGPRLAQVLAVERGDLAVAAARALGGMVAAASESPLVAALSSPSLEVSAAAAQALGKAGSLLAVLPLREAAERRTESAFQRAARQAIAEIRARSPGASPGQLSLAAGAAGRVSLAAAEAGSLSLPAGEAGRLSLVEAPAKTSPPSGAD